MTKEPLPLGLDRERLRALRAELASETARLHAEVDALNRTDIPAVRGLVAALKAHHQRLQEYHDALEQFHTTIGALKRR